MKKLSIKSGDTVVVLSGKDKGKQGKVVAELALGAAQHTDALDFLGAGVVGHLQISFLLNHAADTSLFRLLDDLNHAPPLVLGQGAGLHDLDAVAHAALVVLIMSFLQHATNQLDNPLRIAEVKKDIARVKTIIREQQLAGR